MRRVVITGIGAVTPVGIEKEKIRAAAANGTNGISEISLFDNSDIGVKFAGEAKCFCPTDYYSKREIMYSSRYILMGRLAAQNALRDSGLDKEAISAEAERVGVVMASAGGGMEAFEKACETIMKKGVHRISPMFIPTFLTDMAGNNIAIDLGARGTCQCISTACASGSDSVGSAYLRIANGFEDVIFAGGSEAVITKAGVGGFAAMRVLYEGDDVSQSSIPFDKRRSGFVVGEGACCLVLEEEEHARKRGADIYAEIVGYGSTCDAADITAPDYDGIYRAMKLALNGLDPSKVGYINAHGTSTHMNDVTETKAIKKLFGDDTPLVSSTKSIMGHLLAAAGSIEAAITAMAVKYGELPVNAGYKEPDPECDINLVTEPMKKEIEYAVSNSLGFGGHNAAILFKKYN